MTTSHFHPPAYEDMPSRAHIPWDPATKGDRPWDQLDFHIDLGCGRVPKARFGIDKALPEDRDWPGWSMDFDGGHQLPFEDESVKSIISHHCLEHVGPGFERLMEECYRVLEWGGVMRIIVPLFPSQTAVSDYDHKRYFMRETWIGFTGVPGGTIYSEGFAEPYNTCRFKILDNECSPPTPPEKQWTAEDAREQRVTLWKHRGTETEDRKP